MTRWVNLAGFAVVVPTFRRAQPRVEGKITWTDYGTRGGWSRAWELAHRFSVMHKTPGNDWAGIGAKGSGHMFQKLSAGLVSGVLAVAVLTTVAPAAHAVERPTGVVLHDGSRDVWEVHFAPEGESTATRAGVPEADVTRAFIRHATFAVRIRMRFANLRRVGVQSYEVQIGTPRNAYFAQVRSSPGARRGTHSFDGGQGTGCRRMTHRIDYADNVVTMRIPRRCLGRPRWVRVGLTNALRVEGSNGEGEHLYVDNPHNHGPFSDEVTRRLYRG